MTIHEAHQKQIAALALEYPEFPEVGKLLARASEQMEEALCRSGASQPVEG